MAQTLTKQGMRKLIQNFVALIEEPGDSDYLTPKQQALVALKHRAETLLQMEVR